MNFELNFPVLYGKFYFEKKMGNYLLHWTFSSMNAAMECAMQSKPMLLEPTADKSFTNCCHIMFV